MRIAIIGIDGSGKTTLARSVARALRARGERAKYFENAGGRPIMNGIAQVMRRPDGVALFGRAYEPIEMRFRLLAMRRTASWARPGRIAVCDRWTFCQHAVMAARGSITDGLAQLYAAIPAPDLVLFLDVDPALAQQRVELRGKDHETLEHLAAYDAAYRALPEFGSFTHIDASGTPEEVLRQALTFV